MGGTAGVERGTLGGQRCRPDRGLMARSRTASPLQAGRWCHNGVPHGGRPHHPYAAVAQQHERQHPQRADVVQLQQVSVVLRDLHHRPGLWDRRACRGVGWGGAGQAASSSQARTKLSSAKRCSSGCSCPNLPQPAPTLPHLVHPANECDGLPVACIQGRLPGGH